VLAEPLDPRGIWEVVPVIASAKQIEGPQDLLKIAQRTARKELVKRGYPESSTMVDLTVERVLDHCVFTYFFSVRGRRNDYAGEV